MSLTIKQKLVTLAVVAVFAMLAMAALLFYAVGTTGELQQARLLNTQIERDLLMLRRHEKDFLARKDLKYRTRFDDAIAHMSATLEQLDGVLSGAGVSTDGIDQLRGAADRYRERFAALTATVEEVGLNEKSGLLGTLREAVHGAETILKEVDDDRLMRDMLMLRRNEKDFIARGALKYLDKFENNYQVFLASLEGTVLSEQRKEDIVRNMERYRGDFRAMVAGFERRGLDPKSGLLGELRTAAHQAEKTLSELDGRLEGVLAERDGQIRTMVMVAVVAGIALILLLLTGIARAIIQPINCAVDYMRDIADGEGDLTACLNAEAGDEMANLGGAFNTFVAKIRDLVRRITDAATQLSTVAEESSAVSSTSNEHIRRQRDEIAQVAAAVEQMIATLREMADHAAQAAQSADEARTQAGDGRAVAERAVETVNALSSEVNQAAEVTTRLAEESANIGAVLEVIGGIAEQTNLLALNAAIEAARAGEQGRGFAVVADEVRTLASRTQESTEEIQRMIESVRGGVDEAVRVMEASRLRVDAGVGEIREAGNALAGIAGAVERITEMNRNIARATEEQRGAVDEIGSNVNRIRDASEETANGALQTAQAGEQLAELANGMNGLVTQFKV